MGLLATTFAFASRTKHRTHRRNAQLQMTMRETGVAGKKIHVLRAALVVSGAMLVAVYMLSGLATCPIARVLHVPCPGCGSTRSLRALLIDHALGPCLRANPVAPFAAFAIAALVFRAAFVVARDGDLRVAFEGPAGRAFVRALALLLAVDLAVWILRFLGFFGGPVPV
jgi:hypothetical protein